MTSRPVGQEGHCFFSYVNTKVGYNYSEDRLDSKLNKNRPKFVKRGGE